MSDGAMVSGPYGFEPTWPMPDLGERYGTVHVHEEIEEPPDNPYWTHADKLREPSLPRYFIASWQARVDGEVIFAPYFKFDELDEALSWSRERASRVRLVIYEGRRVAYSAHDAPPERASGRDHSGGSSRQSQRLQRLPPPHH